MEPVESSDLDHARSELREGIDNSREIVRQARQLIELSEAPAPSGEDDAPIAS